MDLGLTTISKIALLIAFILASMGGIADMSNNPRMFIVSKEHLWIDALIALQVAILFQLPRAK
jgi:hypothetical protein